METTSFEFKDAVVRVGPGAVRLRALIEHNEDRVLLSVTAKIEELTVRDLQLENRRTHGIYLLSMCYFSPGELERAKELAELWVGEGGWTTTSEWVGSYDPE